MSGKRFSGERGKKNGFYLALAVCLVAVGIAAWSTYEAVQGYLTPEDNAASQADPRAEDGENFIRATPKPAPEKVQETDASEADPPESESKKTDAPPEPETPVAETGPLYLISEVMIQPVSGDVLKEYSKGVPVFSPTMKDWRIHTGLDLIAESGEAVKSAANGMVQDVYTDPLLGNIVAIEHGDYVFYYCGLGEEFEVESGEIISAGQTIGTITAVPSEVSDESHLHLEVRRDGARLDPTEVFAEFSAE